MIHAPDYHPKKEDARICAVFFVALRSGKILAKVRRPSKKGYQVYCFNTAGELVSKMFSTPPQLYPTPIAWSEYRALAHRLDEWLRKSGRQLYVLNEPTVQECWRRAPGNLCYAEQDAQREEGWAEHYRGMEAAIEKLGWAAGDAVQVTNNLLNNAL